MHRTIGFLSFVVVVVLTVAWWMGSAAVPPPVKRVSDASTAQVTVAETSDVVETAEVESDKPVSASLQVQQLVSGLEVRDPDTLTTAQLADEIQHIEKRLEDEGFIQRANQGGYSVADMEELNQVLLQLNALKREQITRQIAAIEDKYETLLRARAGREL